MRRIAPVLALACLIVAHNRVAAQEAPGPPIAFPERWLQGFATALSGETLIYPWAYPGHSPSLLTRATTGRMAIEWKGEALPPGVTDEQVTYLWHAGMASGYGAHRFTLSINGAPCATFTSARTTADREWVLRGPAGCSVGFTTTRVGTFNELFGFMWVTAPRAAVGTAPTFSVVGEAAGSSDYFMTFQAPVSSWTRAAIEEARFRDGSRVLRIEASRAASPGQVVVRAGTEGLHRGTLATGYTSLLLPLRTAGSVAEVVVEIAGIVALSQRVTLPPVRPWAIHLLPHSHVDIGYSDPQPVVEQKQWKNLREAAALAARTRGYPPGARFKWNVEGLWSVESYLKQAGEAERLAFLAAVKDGAIDLQANYTNVLTGLATPEELDHWTDGARRLQAAYGIGPLQTAMHTDIPGLSWTVVRALARAGVKYFSSGPNYMPGLPDGGDRIGRTLSALGDKPFWWESPSGEERLLFWMAGRGYSWFHGMNLGSMETAGRQPLLDYLRELNEAGYPYDMVQVRYTIGGDNGPVDPRLPDLVRAWNETFDTPRLVIDTAASLFAEFERRYGGHIPTRRGDMTPYWEDGAVSTPQEEALVRGAARRLQQAEALWAIRNPSGYPAADFAEAWRTVTLWHEHTWGAADSVSDPDRKDVVDQWLYKREFAVQADTRSRRLLEGAAPATGAALEVVNTLSWPRDGLVMLSTREAGGRQRVLDAAGRPLPSQRLADGRVAVWLGRVPALAAARIAMTDGPAASPARPAAVHGTTIDNGPLRVVIDGETGDIRSLQAVAAPGVEFAAAGAGLNAYRYVAGLDPSLAQPAGRVRVVVEEAGPLVATLRIEGDAPGTTGLVRRVTLVAGDDRVWLETAIEKRRSREKESVHLAFPVNVRSPIVRFDEGAALVEVGRGQLPGSCRDFVGVHSAADVSGDGGGLTIATLDAPLVEIGSITDERRPGGAPRRWPAQAASGGALYSYVQNNYWHTNYKADQEGRLELHFVLRPHGRFDEGEMRRGGATLEQPLLVRRVDAGAPATPPPFRLEGGQAVVSALVPLDAGRGLKVEIYNPTPVSTVARMIGIWRGRTVAVTSPGAPPHPLTADGIDVKPFGTATIEIVKVREPAVRERAAPVR